MKKFTLLFLLMLINAATAFAGDDTLNYVRPDGKRQGHWIITGEMQKNTAYAAKAKVEEGRYDAGLKTGIWTNFRPDGSKEGEYTYVNNRPNGHAVRYNPNGTKAEEGTWVGTHWVGEYQLFYEDGTPRQKFNYNPLGQSDGVETYYNPNGTKQIEVTKKNGKEDGWKKEYDANGNLVRETFFNNGVLDPSKTIEHKAPTTQQKAPEDPANDKAEKATKASANEKPSIPNWNGEGQNTLMNGGQVTQKGTFHNFTLVDGEKRFYDQNGQCVRVKLYKGGVYIGDGPLPTDK